MAVFKSFPGLKFQKVKFKYFKHLVWTLLNDLRNGPALISWKDFQPRLYWTDNDLCNFLYYCNSIWLCCLLLFSNIARVFSKRHLIIKILEIIIWYVPYFQLHEVFMHKWILSFFPTFMSIQTSVFHRTQKEIFCKFFVKKIRLW